MWTTDPPWWGFSLGSANFRESQLHHNSRPLQSRRLGVAAAQLNGAHKCLLGNNLSGRSLGGLSTPTSTFVPSLNRGSASRGPVELAVAPLTRARPQGRQRRPGSGSGTPPGEPFPAREPGRLPRPPGPLEEHDGVSESASSRRGCRFLRSMVGNYPPAGG